MQWIQHILEEQKAPAIFVSWLKSENILEKEVLQQAATFLLHQI